MVRLYPAIGFESEKQYERSDLVFPGEGFEVCETSPEYRPRRPEDSVLYGIVAGHLESFLALDGIYVINEKGELVFRRVPPPSDAEVARVAERIHRSVARLMERQGLGPQADPDEADSLRHDEPLLAELYSASISGRAATGSRAGRRIARVGDDVDSGDAALPPGRCSVAVAGFSVHAGVCVPPRDRKRLQRLCRYAGRPPIATERLSLLPDGRLLYRLKHRWRDRTTHVIYEPLELLERLAALQ